MNYINKRTDNNTNDFIFGLHPVIEAIESGQNVDKILLRKGFAGELSKELFKITKDYQIPVQQVPVEKIDSITRKNHQGVLAFLSPVEFNDIDTIVSETFEKGELPFIVALDQITDVRNMGSIIRTAECAGAHAILISAKGSARISSDTVKTSAGAIFHLPVCRTDSLLIKVKNLQKSGLQIIAASEKANENYYNTDFTKPFVLILGSEEFGITPEIIRQSDSFVKIPVCGKIKSLNVSNAAAVLMYEALKQRDLKI